LNFAPSDFVILYVEIFARPDMAASDRRPIQVRPEAARLTVFGVGFALNP
jgi:hypothetical protein